MTEKSNECKKCIDDDNRWCPTSTYSSGYCCSGNDVSNCPRASMCVDEFSHVDLKYMLCPNEVGCLFQRNIAPPINGAEKLFEQVTGTFLKNDVCTFKITIPQATDLNDIMYIKFEYINNAEGTIVKGANLVDAISLSKARAGQTYSATKGINFYVSFRALSTNSGDFVFKIWYKEVSGSGERAPEVVTFPENFVDTNIYEED
jgi:hypothetical protein